MLIAALAAVSYFGRSVAAFLNGHISMFSGGNILALLNVTNRGTLVCSLKKS
jgi:hypothetical protein